MKSQTEQHFILPYIRHHSTSDFFFLFLKKKHKVLNNTFEPKSIFDNFSSSKDHFHFNSNGILSVVFGFRRCFTTDFFRIIIISAPCTLYYNKDSKYFCRWGIFFSQRKIIVFVFNKNYETQIIKPAADKICSDGFRKAETHNLLW